jgi:hypothetical protein
VRPYLPKCSTHVRSLPRGIAGRLLAVRRVLPIALLATAVINGLLFLWIVSVKVTGGYWLDYVWIVVNALSAYGCWVAGKHLLQEGAEAVEAASSPRA